MGDADEVKQLRKKLARYVHAIQCIDRDIARAAERYLADLPVPGGTINFVVFLDLLEKQIRQEAYKWAISNEVHRAIKKKLNAIRWNDFCRE